MKVLKDWTVTLRNSHRRQIYRRVRSCVSAQAACDTAYYLYHSIPGDCQNIWRPVFAHPITKIN